MIIGNKKSFAVEYTPSKSDSKMGYGKIWIQDQFFGSNEDLIYLDGYMISLIDELINAKPLAINFQKKSNSELFRILENHPNRFTYLLHGSTFTDDFSAYIFQNEGMVYLIWKLRSDQKPIFSDLKDYGTEIKFSFAEKVEIEDVKSLLQKKASA